MCHPKCIFTLQLVAAHLHDQVTTSKEIQRATEILFSVGFYFMVQSRNAGTQANFNLRSQKINPYCRITSDICESSVTK